jgi:hypothetical protein
METLRIKRPHQLRLVALDTEVFDKVKFNYNSNSFIRLVKLAKEKKVAIYLTTINQQEILSHLEKLSKESVGAWKKCHSDFRKKSSILYNSTEYKYLLNLELDEKKLYNELIKQFNGFIQEAQITLLRVDSVSPEDVFSKYFQLIPPFKDGAKKHEFPDAFAIAAIENLAKNENQDIYVISGDNDWKNTVGNANNLIYKESIDQLLKEIIIEERLQIDKESEDVNFCYKILENNIKEIKHEISNSFTSKEFSFSYYFDDGYFDPNSEDIEFIKVHAIKIIETNIVDINDKDPENPVVTFELEAAIIYTAYISYDKTEYAFWSQEEERYYSPIMRIKGKVRQSNTLSVEVTLQLARDSVYNLCFDSIVEVILDPDNTVRNIELSSDNFVEQISEQYNPYEDDDEEFLEEDDSLS